MSNWIDTYKKYIISSNKQYVIVTDEDNLFEYQELFESIQSDGYKIYKANSFLDVRILFELHCRSSDQKIIIIAPNAYQPLPDIHQLVNFQALQLKQIFPNLDRMAIKGLSFNALSMLFRIKQYDSLGYENTIKFILENLYNIDVDTITSTKERVANALIIAFLEKNELNDSLIDYFTKLANLYYPELALNGNNKENLIRYISSEWDKFIRFESSYLNFLDPLINRHLGYLCMFDYLKPLEVTNEKYLSLSKALRVGVYVDKNQSINNELESLITYLYSERNNLNDSQEKWYSIISALSKAKTHCILTSYTILKDQFMELEKVLNNLFQQFLLTHYKSLFSLSAARKPIVVSRILDFMKTQSNKKKALLVIDGMNYWQWHQIAINLNEFGINFDSKATFAFIPTITAWSRQAIFKGDKPDLSKDNSTEEKLFREYWSNNGYQKFEIDFFEIGINHMFDKTKLSENIAILGLVCNDLDKMMHGNVLGNTELLGSTKEWVLQSKIIETIQDLKEFGYTVYITADHGNIEAVGIKNIKQKEKVGSIGRSKRHIHFNNQTMFNSFLSENSTFDLGKDEDSLSVYLKNNEAFTVENTKVITHGGSHFWEVIVPFIEI